MPLYVYVGAVALVAAVPLMWYAIASARMPLVDLVRSNLDQSEGFTDLRDVELTRSARDRIVDPLVEGLAARARRLTPAGLLTALERRIALAGLAHRWPIERVLAAKLVLGALGTLFALGQVAGGVSFNSVVLGAAVMALGYFAPDLVLYGRGRERQAAIRKALPDVLDQVSVSVEAGLGFEAALQQAARSGQGPLAEELGRMIQDIQIGVRRTEALENILARTDVADLRHFVLAMKQAERYGVPIAQVLRVQSKELREKRRQRAEEQAMKVPVKIVVPLVFCILPALFVVILGPAALRLYEALIK